MTQQRRRCAAVAVAVAAVVVAAAAAAAAGATTCASCIVNQHGPTRRVMGGHRRTLAAAAAAAAKKRRGELAATGVVWAAGGGWQAVAQWLARLGPTQANLVAYRRPSDRHRAAANRWRRRIIGRRFRPSRTPPLGPTDRRVPTTNGRTYFRVEPPESAGAEGVSVIRAFLCRRFCRCRSQQRHASGEGRRLLERQRRRRRRRRGPRRASGV